MVGCLVGTGVGCEVGNKFWLAVVNSVLIVSTIVASVSPDIVTEIPDAFSNTVTNTPLSAYKSADRVVVNAVTRVSAYSSAEISLEGE